MRAHRLHWSSAIVCRREDGVLCPHSAPRNRSAAAICTSSGTSFGPTASCSGATGETALIFFSNACAADFSFIMVDSFGRELSPEPTNGSIDDDPDVSLSQTSNPRYLSVRKTRAEFQSEHVTIAARQAADHVGEVLVQFASSHRSLRVRVAALSLNDPIDRNPGPTPPCTQVVLHHVPRDAEKPRCQLPLCGIEPLQPFESSEECFCRQFLRHIRAGNAVAHVGIHRMQLGLAGPLKRSNDVRDHRSVLGRQSQRLSDRSNLLQASRPPMKCYVSGAQTYYRPCRLSSAVLPLPRFDSGRGPTRRPSFGKKQPPVPAPPQPDRHSTNRPAANRSFACKRIGRPAGA